jgi:hypothetical protein
LLAPRDPNDSSDALMEIKSGEGGEESALFAADLLKMYSRYAESRGWKVEILDAQETDLGGYKSVTIAIKAPPLASLTRCPTAYSSSRAACIGCSGFRSPSPRVESIPPQLGAGDA